MEWGLVTTIAALVAALGGLALYAKQEKLEQLEQLLGARSRKFEEQERRFEEAMTDLDQRERALVAREEELAAAEARLAREPLAGDPATSGPCGEPPADRGVGLVTLLFVPGPAYRFAEVEHRSLTVGAALELDGESYVVAHIGRAPLPGDDRVCAYLERDESDSPQSDGNS
jgi:multidrug efflux pump subunit AcrA (membrane-fusion protein)